MAQQPLFGYSPEQIMQARQAAMQERAAAEASRVGGGWAPLYEQARGLSMMGAEALGRGLFPQAQDPALQRAQVTQSIVQKYRGQDINDPDVLRSMATDFSSAGLNEIALQLGEESKKRVVAPTDPKKQAESIVLNIGQIPEEQRTEAQKAMYASAQNLLSPASTKEPVKIGVSTTNKPVYRQGLQQFILGPNEEKIPYFGDIQSGGTTVKIDLGKPSEIMKAISEVNSNTKPLTDKINTLDSSIGLRINKDSPFSQAAFSQEVGRAFGDAQKAATEIQRLVNTGSLGQRLENSFNLFLTGNIGQLTRDDQMEVLLGLREFVGTQYDQTVEPYRAAAEDKADKIAKLSKERFALPKLSGNRQYIPMTIVNQYNLKKGDVVKQGNKQLRYNGDGTVTILKGE